MGTSEVINVNAQRLPYCLGEAEKKLIELSKAKQCLYFRKQNVNITFCQHIIL